MSIVINNFGVSLDIGRFDTAISPLALAEQVKGAGFKRAVAEIPKVLFEKTEGEFEKIVRLSSMDHLIKESFWREYLFARLENRKMNTKNIYGHICTYTHFYNNILKSPYKLAWILSPILGIPKSLISFQSLIIEKIYEILQADICYINGKPNNRVIDAKIRVFEVLTEHLV